MVSTRVCGQGVTMARVNDSGSRVAPRWCRPASCVGVGFPMCVWVAMNRLPQPGQPVGASRSQAEFAPPRGDTRFAGPSSFTLVEAHRSPRPELGRARGVTRPWAPSPCVVGLRRFRHPQGIRPEQNEVRGHLVYSEHVMSRLPAGARRGCTESGSGRTGTSRLTSNRSPRPGR